MYNMDDIAITIAGEAGQGIDTITDIIMKTFKSSGYNVFSSNEYMSRIRGGTNSSQIRISSSEVYSAVEKTDLLFALSQNSIDHAKNNLKNLKKETFILYDEALANLSLESYKSLAVPISSSAVKLGGKIFSNIISAGIIFGIFNLESNLIEENVRKNFSDKTGDIILKNIEAAKIGYEIGKNITALDKITVAIQKDESVEEKILVNTTQSVALGCIAGGCDFISSYPMSPSTGVLIYLSQKSDDFNIIVEQAEDEICAMNMAIGAWSVGARAMTSTSGGGFDLMSEGLSLAGIIESPMVVYLAQRPGPATGFPTRTEQADLNLALYSGHGEFPRIILTPGTNEDAFFLARDAFNLADKYQVPVFILTDQYLADAFSLCKSFELNNNDIQNFIVKTDLNYKRYKFTDDGISPRGIAGFGEGFVKICSDEHEEDGDSTENFDVKEKMTEKRLKKYDLIKNEIYQPELFGSEKYKTLLIGWGSTCNAIKEAVKIINSPDLSFLYFKQVCPLPDIALSYLEKAQKTICIENNATGQFAGLIRRELGFNVQNKILKYNGLPFFVDELVNKIKDLV